MKPGMSLPSGASSLESNEKAIFVGFLILDKKFPFLSFHMLTVAIEDS